MKVCDRGAFVLWNAIRFAERCDLGWPRDFTLPIDGDGSEDC